MPTVKGLTREIVKGLELQPVDVVVTLLQAIAALVRARMADEEREVLVLDPSKYTEAEAAAVRTLKGSPSAVFFRRLEK